MSSIQNIYGQKTHDERLSLEWEVLGKPIAISIQIALDSEFTQETRTFVLHNSLTSCILDIGAGNWFYRAGAWIGTDTDGIIEWSGIYGPVVIQSKKGIVPLTPFPTFLTAIKPVLNGVVFHTGLNQRYYMVIHSTRNEHFKSSGLKSFYKHDWGNGSIQVSHLDPKETYSFQLQMFTSNIATLPDVNTIQLLTESYIVTNKKAAMPIKATNGTEKAVYAADRAMLQDAASGRKQTFFSYAQYLQFQAAKARTSASQQ